MCKQGLRASGSVTVSALFDWLDALPPGRQALVVGLLLSIVTAIAPVLWRLMRASAIRTAHPTPFSRRRVLAVAVAVVLVLSAITAYYWRGRAHASTGDRQM